MADGKRVLVADDADTVTTVLVTALEIAGYQVDTAADGMEAFEKGRTRHYDLAILDQLMPGLLGLEVIERWREEGVRTPVMMLSGVDDDHTIVESFDLGAVDFIRKPFRLQELMARIRQRV